MNETWPGEASCSIIKETVTLFQQNERYPISIASINILLSIFLRIFAFNGKKLISLKRFSAKMKWDTDLSSDVNSIQLAVIPYSTTLRILETPFRHCMKEYQNWFGTHSIGSRSGSDGNSATFCPSLI